MIQETEWKQQPARMVGSLSSDKFMSLGQDVQIQTLPFHMGLGGAQK